MISGLTCIDLLWGFRRPDGWRPARLKTSVRWCQNGLWGDEPDGVDDLVVVRVADFDRVRRRVHLSTPTMRAIPRNKRAGRLLQRGDLLIEKSGGGGDLQPVGTVVLYDLAEAAVCSNFVARMPVAPGHDAGFLCYLHQALYDAGITGRSIKQTTGIQNLDAEGYLQELVLVPSEEYQRKLATFLDRKTGAIDALIAKKERLVVLLQEKRQALITQAVTKGLDPNVPMKDSGIASVGKMPAHWQLHHLRRVVARFIDYRGRTPAKVDEGVPLITAGAVREGRIDHARAPEYMAHSEYAEFMRSRGFPAIGDLVFTSEAPLGEVAQVEDTRVAFAQRIILFKVNTARITADFLWLYYQSTAGKADVLARASGSTAEGIRADRLRGSAVVVPPLEEQAQIVAEVRRKLTVFAPLVTIVEHQIKLLRQYRQALITAAVIGKIDVTKEAA